MLIQQFPILNQFFNINIYLFQKKKFLAKHAREKRLLKYPVIEIACSVIIEKEE